MNLGWIYKELGNLDQALASTLKSLELKPDNPAAHTNDETFLMIHSPLLAKHFTREMDRMWRGAELGITRISIANRLSTIQNADQIVILERGKPSESGNWDSLRNHGYLKRMLASH